MIGIKIKDGALFVEHEGVTVRVSSAGECDVSPVLFMVVEWDLRCEPLDRWEYLTESRIKALDNGVYEKVLAVVNRVHSVLED